MDCMCRLNPTAPAFAPRGDALHATGPAAGEAAKASSGAAKEQEVLLSRSRANAEAERTGKRQPSRCEKLIPCPNHRT